MGFNLVLVARRISALKAIGNDLVARYGIIYRAFVQDLKHESAGLNLNEATMDLDVGLYVSNAGSDGAGASFL